MKTSTSRATLDLGDFRNIVILKAPVTTTGDRNNKIVTYPEIGFVQAFARVDPGGNERSLQEANLTFDNVVTVWVYYLAALKSDWKVHYDGFDYTIHKIDNVDSRNRFLKILCYAKTG